MIDPETKRNSILCILMVSLQCLAMGQLETFEIGYPYRGEVTEMTFDSAGFLWFHDGKDFYRYNGHQTEAIELGRLLGKRKYDYTMYNDLIFIGDQLLLMNGDNLSLLQPSSEEIIDIWQLPEDRYFSYVYKDELGHIWVITAHRHNDSRVVYYSEDGTDFREVFDLIDYIGDQAIYWDFFEMNDKNGVLYFLWRWGDLLIVDKNGKEMVPETADLEEFQSKRACAQFRLDNEKNLWRIYQDTFEILNSNTRAFESHPLTGRLEFATDCKRTQDVLNRKLGLPEIGSLLDLRFIHTDQRDRIWMGCAASYLLCYDPTNQNIEGFRAALVGELEGGDNDIKEMIEDASGNLWGSKTGGLFKIRDRARDFDSYLINTGDPDHEIYQDKDDVTLQNILSHYNDYAIRNTSIHSLGEDQLGNLIFQEGVFTYRLNLESREVEILPIFSPKESVHLTFHKDLQMISTWETYYKIGADFSTQKMNDPILKVEQTLVQENGNVWFLGLLDNFNYLFAKMDSETLAFQGNYKDAEGRIDLAINKPNGMDEDEHGNIWIATDEGLLMLDTEKNMFSPFDDELIYQGKLKRLGPLMVSVHCLSANRLWMVSKYEIALLDTEAKEIEAYFPIDEDISGPETKILPVGDSAIWIGDQMGLTYRNVKNDRSASFGVANGLDPNGAVRALRKLSNGEIAIGTRNGLYLMDPEELLKKHARQQDNDSKVPLTLTSSSFIVGDDGSVHESKFSNRLDEKIIVEYNDKMLQLEYSLMNFDFPDRHIYSTRLEGFDPGWSTPTSSNMTRYASLPAGDYTFRVRGSTGRGSWSETEISQAIRVRQAWFRSIWFILPSLALLSFITLAVARSYYRQKLEKRLAIEKLRNKISRDLHDDVGSVLAGISMQSEFMSFAPLEADKKSLKELSTRSREAMDKMRDIVWAMNADRDKYENLLDRMRAFAQTHLEKTKLRFKIIHRGFEGAEMINPEIRQNLYFLFKEAVTNAAKHSNGDQLEALLIKSDTLLELSIKDNGTSFTSQKADGLGFSNMTKRAHDLNGTIEFTHDDGFMISVNIPL